MMRNRLVNVTVWVCLLALAGMVALHARYTADLSAFLPMAPSKAQRFLVDQLREGLASRLILVDIAGADATIRASLSNSLAIRLRTTGAFRSVRNGESVGLEGDREFIVNHRYLLSDRMTAEHFTVSGLHSSISDSIDLLSSPMGLIAQDLFVRDPTGETLQAAEQLGQFNSQPRSIDGVWVSRDGKRALLMAQTRAQGSDTDGQERAIEIIHRAFHDAQIKGGASPKAPLVLRLSGPGVFAVQARTTIQHEAIRLSILSSLVIASLLFFVYRSVPVLVLGLLPVVSGALAGIAAVALGFGVVHGVTLGFGVTLIGEAVDYSVYLFIQSALSDAANAGNAPNTGVTAWAATFWPTIRLGMLTSICGFATLVPSKFPGLAQLGVYSIAGLLAAGLATRFVLPSLLPKNLGLGIALPIGRGFARALSVLRAWRHALWLLPCVAVLVLYAHRDHLWNRELAALSPIPLAVQSLDAELRADLGAPDVRTLIILTGKTSEAVLQASEAIGKSLDTMVATGAIASYQAPSRYLPSAATQQLRRTSLPSAEEMAARLKSAVKGLPIQAARLQPFLRDIDAARASGLIRRSDLVGTSLASGVDALLVRRGKQWNGLLPLQAARSGPYAFSVDTTRVKQAIASTATNEVEATVLDLKNEADALYSGYLSDAMRLSLLGFGAILALLLFSLRSARRVFRVVVPLILAVLAVMSGLALAGHALTILHLVGLLLIIAIGSNYALFFDRESSLTNSNAASRMLASLLIANLTTVIGFGTLAFSSVPVLASLGMTVAPGTLLALLFSAVIDSNARKDPECLIA